MKQKGLRKLSLKQLIIMSYFLPPQISTELKTHIIDNQRFIRNNHRVSNSFSQTFYELSLWNSVRIN